MGGISSYSSPKTSYEPSYSVSSTPKSSSYESSKVSTMSTPASKPASSISSILSGETLEKTTSSKSDLNSFRDLITSFLEVNEKIESTTEALEKLQKKKSELEEEISNNPEFEKFSAMFASINNTKGPKR